MARIQHFLLVFDHAAGALSEETRFGEERERAVQAYAECESKFRDQPEIEIVLIGSDSLKTVRRTHANYYDGTVSAGGATRFLQGI